MVSRMTPSCPHAYGGSALPPFAKTSGIDKNMIITMEMGAIAAFTPLYGSMGGVRDENGVVELS